MNAKQSELNDLDEIASKNALIIKLKLKLLDCEDALVETTSILRRVIHACGRTYPETSYPKAAKVLDWFYDQKEYDGPCKDKIL